MSQLRRLRRAKSRQQLKMLRDSRNELRLKLINDERFKFINRDHDDVIRNLSLIRCGELEKSSYTKDQLNDFIEYCRIRSKVDNKFRRDVTLLEGAYKLVNEKLEESKVRTESTETSEVELVQ